MSVERWGGSSKYLSNVKAKNRELTAPMTNLVCLLLNCNKEDFELTETTAEVRVEQQSLLDFRSLEDKIDKLSQKIDALLGLYSPDMLTSQNKAYLLLKQMMGSNGRCDEQDFVDTASQLQINKQDRQYAIAKCDCNVITTGYGKNAHRVIVKKFNG